MEGKCAKAKITAKIISAWLKQNGSDGMESNAAAKITQIKTGKNSLKQHKWLDENIESTKKQYGTAR